MGHFPGLGLVFFCLGEPARGGRQMFLVAILSSVPWTSAGEDSRSLGSFADPEFPGSGAV